MVTKKGGRPTVHEIPLGELVIDLTLSPRAGIDKKWVEYLAEVIDLVPPVEVVQVNGDKLLAEGFHRYYAATRAGRQTLRGKVRPGTRLTAASLAISENMTHGKPLTAQERHAAIRRYAEVNLEMSQTDMARDLGISQQLVSAVIKTKPTPQGGLSLSKEKELTSSGLPEEVQEKIRDVAKEKKWTTDDVAAAVETQKSDQINPEYKEKALAGEVPPITFKGGEPAFTVSQVAQGAVEALAKDVRVKFAKAWAAATAMDNLIPEEVVDSLDSGGLKMVNTVAPVHMEWVSELLRLTQQRMELRTSLEDI